MAEFAGKQPLPSRTSPDCHSFHGSDWSDYSAGPENIWCISVDEVYGVSVATTAEVVFGISTVEECEASVVAARRLAAEDARSNRRVRH